MFDVVEHFGASASTFMPATFQSPTRHFNVWRDSAMGYPALGGLQECQEGRE